ncbi:MAG TPA: aminomethyl-transferring glycine dehydrogenase [Acidimicrobiales bacterium]|nr:aminomethyl-transferring glycine dehydrogenase [Acidimicrobiales bacterium]
MTDQATLPGAFPDRHIGISAADADRMLAMLGLASLDDLIDQAVPAAIRDDKPLALDDALSEPHALAHLRRLADRNTVFTSLIGQGYYGTHTPGVILRNVLENPAWYTAYTPYQPEISQGRLEALLNFQTMVCDLTGLEIANASMLDEGTAAGEAMTLCRRSSRHAGGVFFVDAECHPQTIAVVATRAEPLGIDVVVGDPSADLSPVDTFGVLLQHPGTSGVVRDLRAVIEAVHSAGGLAVVATDLLACTLLVPPGELGADVAVGSAQRFGVPMGFGGPHPGFLATRDAYRRSLPGRLVGVSIDAAGRPAHRLALQTREQHIRREKATSNICTAQVLLAVMASMYAVYHGAEGLEAIAERVHMQATATARTLGAAGFDVVNDTWFDTLTVRAPGQAAEIFERAREAGVNLRRVDGDTLGLSFDETTFPALPLVLAAFGVADGFVTGDDGIPTRERRTTEYLTHPVFHEHRSETEMLRYLRRLADKDVALDRAMIPLGSCTMKLNATTEMEPVTWPEFADIHPFAPLDQAEGYLELIHELEAMLGEMTGYDAVSLQPNAGSQGELAGLLAIRAYHHSRGDEQRDVCLIPSSAHGTNAASAVMAGMRVVVVACDDHGNVDVDDFRSRAAEHGERLAALMVTYPSTHGVFESRITEICDVVHEHGGQVYVDGANLNALVGVARPGWFGGDISHLNLHKTFCIPHGGGGPGVGPVAARAHLAPFLPNHPATAEAGPATGPGPVSAAPWGSAGILPISYAYAKLMGADGLRRATEVAILSANYIAVRLADHYPVLYTGDHGRVAHECIVDVRAITRDTGVTVDDVAKRLIDYGFHAPTMSFPVAGTLMIEPTESESLAEIDRFCDAMIAIKGEIDRVASGEWPLADSPLRHAPHTAEDLLVGDWDRPYSREQGAYPVAGLRRAKYWPPVSRIDGGYGDRHLVCACPPPEDFERA